MLLLLKWKFSDFKQLFYCYRKKKRFKGELTSKIQLLLKMKLM